MSTVTARVLRVGAVAAVMMAAESSAAAETDWNAAPPHVVVESLAGGGAAATEADRLAGYIPGEPPPSRTIEYTYGPPIRVLIWNQEPQSADASEASASDRLTALDISEIVGERWLAVQYADGEPVSTLEVDEHGNFIVLGNYIESDVQILADLAGGSLVLGASMPGEIDEFYLVSDDHRSVTAINEPAREFLKQESLSAAEFRTLRQTRLGEFIAAQPTDVSDHSIGGALGPSDVPAGEESSVPSFIGLGAAAVAAAALIGAAAVLGHHRARRTRTVDPAV